MKKKCIITGANSGIGKAAAIQIAAKGYHVFIGSRSEERGMKAVEEIKADSGSEDVELFLIDLASKASITKATSEYLKANEMLDVLIHNAADFDMSRKVPAQSPDGIETTWATNHIGPVLLTNLLLESLKKSKQGRIITIASKGLVMHPGLIIDYTDPEFKNKKFTVPKAYYHSKLAQVMYTYWLAEELKDTGITVNCIRVTNVKVDLDRYPDLSKFSRFLYSLKSKSSISPEQMAKTYTLLATGENLEKVTGKYFDEKNKIVSSSKYSLDKNNIEQLMNLTEKYL